MDQKLRPAIAAAEAAAPPQLPSDQHDELTGGEQAAPPAAELLPPAEQVFRVERGRDGAVRCTVLFIRPGVGIVRAYPLARVTRHSPTGFECGYCGSGPADLALSILADFFYVRNADTAGDDPVVRDLWRGTAAEDVARRGAIRRASEHGLYQDFNRDFIADVSLAVGQSEAITAATITEWLRSRPASQSAILLPSEAAEHKDLG